MRSGDCRRGRVAASCGARCQPILWIAVAPLGAVPAVTGASEFAASMLAIVERNWPEVMRDNSARRPAATSSRCGGHAGRWLPPLPSTDAGQAPHLSASRGAGNRWVVWLVGARDECEGPRARAGWLVEVLAALCPAAPGFELVLIGPEMKGDWELGAVRSIRGTLHERDVGGRIDIRRSHQFRHRNAAGAAGVVLAADARSAARAGRAALPHVLPRGRGCRRGGGATRL